MTVSTIDARKQFSEIINKAAYGKERIVLTRRGKPLVAVVPVEDMELLEFLEEQIDIAAAREALKELETIPWEKAKSQLGL